MFGRDADRLIRIGAGLTIVWVIVLAVFWWLSKSSETSGGGTLMMIVLTLMPLILIWLAVLAVGAISQLQHEISELKLRAVQTGDASAPMQQAWPQPPAERPAKAATATHGTASRSTHPAQKPLPKLHAASNQQAALRFDDPEPIEIAPDILVRALNFPNDAHDHAAVSALHHALSDRDLARVLRASQDVITLMARHELYMDDLPPEPMATDPGLWRRFAEGERGREIDVIGSSIEGESALEIARELLRGDEIFRDSAHHFLRHFDQMLTRNLSRLDDQAISALADTRSARAFVLLGRATGIFG